MSAKPASRTMMVVLAVVALNALVLLMLGQRDATAVEAPPPSPFATRLELVEPGQAASEVRAAPPAESVERATPPPVDGGLPGSDAAGSTVAVQAASLGTTAVERPQPPPTEPDATTLALEAAEAVLSCRNWGPFDDPGQADVLLAALRAKGLTGFEQSSELVEKKPHYLVYIGPHRNRKAADKLHRELEEKGVDAHVLERGRLRNAVSVGLYAGPEFAGKQQQYVNSLGYKAEQSLRRRMKRVYHVQGEIEADDLERLSGIDGPSTACETGSAAIASTN